MLKLYFTPDCKALAGRYAQWCALEEVPELPRADGLCLSAEGLGLLSSEFKTPYRIVHRAGAERSELLKAVGRGQTLFDAFAGFGTDAMVLAAHGWTLTLVERELPVWLLLEDAFRDIPSVEIAHGDSLQRLRESPEMWDVIYLDPMFPERNKKALPNRGLQHLRALAREPDCDLAECIALARTRARDRVVLKRSATDPVTLKPSHQVRGKAIRFDVYTG